MRGRRGCLTDGQSTTPKYAKAVQDYFHALYGFSVYGLPSMNKNTRNEGIDWHSFLEEQTKGKLKTN